ncbi:hypothetical protein [Streptomyces sp. NPDC048825]|uniref:hypothetical protein n=1 Tax=Streptomyces sp. NPDC048825 TaxID=3365592 RepID=UPI00371797A9
MTSLYAMTRPYAMTSAEGAPRLGPRADDGRGPWPCPAVVEAPAAKPPAWTTGRAARAGRPEPGGR